MSPSQKAKTALALALTLLTLTGIATGLVAARLYGVESLVRHTYDIEVAIGDLESSLTEMGRNRVAFVNSGDPGLLKSFSNAIGKVEILLARIRGLTSDNPTQLALCDRLAETASRRVASSRESVALKQQNKSDSEKQLQFTYQAARDAFDTASITQQMRQNEDSLLQQRSHLSNLLFTIIPWALAISFLISAGMFWLHYRLLHRELSERTAAENQLRQLSLQLMRVQDEEHRRFARELHDGLGQILAGAKMMADALPLSRAGDAQFAELSAVLDDALAQTRTISHLFHPPFLDEIGFASAAMWLIDGFAQRMGVVVSANISKPQERLPRSLELTLYRVLQESLNNIHRHSGSSKAEVTFQTDGKEVTLRVKDYGLGISRQTMEAFRADGKQVGVGLTGMRERVKEQGGELEIRSDGSGTEIIVRIPIRIHIEAATSMS